MCCKEARKLASVVDKLRIQSVPIFVLFICFFTLCIYQLPSLVICFSVISSHFAALFRSILLPNFFMHLNIYHNPEVIFYFSISVFFLLNYSIFFPTFSIRSFFFFLFSSFFFFFFLSRISFFYLLFLFLVVTSRMDYPIGTLLER